MIREEGFSPKTEGLLLDELAFNDPSLFQLPDSQYPSTVTHNFNQASDVRWGPVPQTYPLPTYELAPASGSESFAFQGGHHPQIDTREYPQLPDGLSDSTSQNVDSISGGFAPLEERLGFDVRGGRNQDSFNLIQIPYLHQPPLLEGSDYVLTVENMSRYCQISLLAAKGKPRRPLNLFPSALIVKLEVDSAKDPWRFYTLDDSLFCMASLVATPASSSTPETLSRSLAGNTTSTAQTLKGFHDEPQAFFAFPELGSYIQGTFCLRVSLHKYCGRDEERHVEYITSILTRPFDVVSKKRWKSLSDDDKQYASPLLYHLHDQGLKCRLPTTGRRKPTALVNVSNQQVDERSAQELSRANSKRRHVSDENKAYLEDAAPSELQNAPLKKQKMLQTNWDNGYASESGR